MSQWFSRIWDKLNVIPAPALDALPLGPVAPPALRQEQFADTHAFAAERAAREHHLYKRVVSANNAAVTRDYGLFTRDETRPPKDFTTSRAPLTAEELKALEAFEIRATRAETQS